jgi:hypothetical protein
VYTVVSAFTSRPAPVVLHGHVKRRTQTGGRPIREQDAEENKKKKVTRGYRKLQNSSPNIINTIKSRKARWSGHVERMGDEKCYKILLRKFERKR